MANRQQVEIIKRGTDAWNGWREQHPGESIDLSDATLSDFPPAASPTAADFTGALRARPLPSDAYPAVPDLSRTGLTGSGLTVSHLSGIDLSGANLSGVNLSGADLSGACLPLADLSGACLIGTNLLGANLTRANLLGVDLTAADLTAAILKDASLMEARLMRANITNAYLIRTDFTRAILGRTIFGDVNLSSTTGLESAFHIGRSVISINTIYLSKGEIPEGFLRGAGVPEGFMDYMPSLTEQPIQFYSCFISYSHKDKAFARRLHDALQGRGIRCWLDEKQLLPGHDIADEVDRGIRLWDKVLLCCSESALKESWWVDKEINKALVKEQELQKERGRKVFALIPLNLDGYLFRGWDDGKATIVKARLAADFKGWEHDNAKFDEQFERVVKALQTDDGREKEPISLL
jgi:uncharacterized protein YjbI with pentapeptide repeats